MLEWRWVRPRRKASTRLTKGHRSSKDNKQDYWQFPSRGRIETKNWKRWILLTLNSKRIDSSWKTKLDRTQAFRASNWVQFYKKAFSKAKTWVCQILKACTLIKLKVKTDPKFWKWRPFYFWIIWKRITNDQALLKHLIKTIGILKEIINLRKDYGLIGNECRLTVKTILLIKFQTFINGEFHNLSVFE